jgi:hypothetical protein
MTTSSGHEEWGPRGYAGTARTLPTASVRGTRDPRPACCRLAGIDVRKLRADAAACFARSGIHHSHVDTAVVRCLIAVTTRPVVNPLNYCLAIGRRFQDESVAEAVARWREFRRHFDNACPHRSSVERCPACAQDRARALELFPTIRRHLSESPAAQQNEDERA